MVLASEDAKEGPRDVRTRIQREVLIDLDTLLHGRRDAINVRRIYGDPVERDGVTVVPAAAVWKPAIDVDRLVLFSFVLGLVLAFRR